MSTRAESRGKFAARQKELRARERERYDLKHGEGSYDAMRKKKDPRYRPPAEEPTPGVPADDAAAECPLKKRHPCDVDKLSITVKHDKDTSKLETTERLVKKPLTRKLVPSARVREELQIYDLIIEVIADPNPGPKSKHKGLDLKDNNFKPAHIESIAHFHGSKCVESAHALLEEVNLGGITDSNSVSGQDDRYKRDTGASMIKLDPAPHYATYYPRFDGAAGDPSPNPLDNVTGALQIVSALWDMLNPRRVEIYAHSCGRRAREDRKPANHALLGLVKIHRKSVFQIGFAIPTGTTAKVEHTSDKYERNAEGKTELLPENQRGNWKTNDKDFLSGDGSWSNFNAAVAAATQKQTPQVIVAHNGRQLEIGKSVENIVKALSAIYDAVTGIADLFRRAPQVGWKFVFDIGVFLGSFAIQIEPKHAKMRAGRWYPVVYEAKGSFAITILKLMMQLSFGIDTGGSKKRSGRKAEDKPSDYHEDEGTDIARLVAKVEATVKAEAGISADFTFNTLEPRTPPKKSDPYAGKTVLGVKSEGSFEFTAVGQATILGKTLAEIKATLTVGVALCDYYEPFKDNNGLTDLNKGGKLILYDEEGLQCDLIAHLCISATEVKFTVSVSWLWDWESDPYRMTEAAKIYSFGFG